MITPIVPNEEGKPGEIWGNYTPGQTVLLIDDLVTYAHSKIEAIRVLEAHGLKVHDVAVLLDREQGGSDILASNGYMLCAALGLRQLLEYLHKSGSIDGETYMRVFEYLEQAGIQGLQ